MKLPKLLKTVDWSDAMLLPGLAAIGGGFAWWIHPGLGVLAVGILLVLGALIASRRS